MSSEPPEEPHLRSEPSLLSPVSPKPIQFPAPTNIPVLEMQMDVGFNQTEAHMNDPAMHNTDVRPDFWRDPKEQEALADTSDQPSPNPAVEEAAQESSGMDTLVAASGDSVTDSKIDAAIDQNQTNNPTLSTFSNAVVSEQAPPAEPAQPSSDPSVPSAEATVPGQEVSPTDPNQSGGDDAQVQPLSDPVNVQALWDTLNPTLAAASDGDSSNVTAIPSTDTLSSLVQSSTAHGSSEASQNGTSLAEDNGVSESSLGVPPSGLPPRPPPQEQPLIHHNYVHSQHIRDYHPHASNPAFQPHTQPGSQGNTADPNTKTYVPPVPSPSSAAAAAPGVPYSQPDPNAYPTNLNIPTSGQAGSNGQPALGLGMPYAPNASSAQHAGYTASPQNIYGTSYPSNTSTPIESRRERTLREGEQPRPEDQPWDAEVQRKYDRFVEVERKYVNEGKWDQFPQGSRLFVGNLSSERVTKRDIYHVFHNYGELAQISIKPAYGFVQFLRTEDCMRALQMEQGTQIRDKKIHLEVSKPQKPRNQNNQRRSRSPPDGRSRPGSNVDRYVSGSRGGNNRGSYGGNYRSPSPRNYRDRHDDRYRRRSRSPPDYSRGGNRYRSPSPRRDIDDLPLPRRAPHEVPDVQIIVLDNTLDRDFISWVETAFSSRGLRTGVLRLAPQLSEQAVVRRQIVEGVVAVIKLTRPNQNSAKIGLQIFDRSQGVNNVKFEEYEGLDPPVAVQLVQRAKASSAPPANAYGYGAQPAYNTAPPPPNPAYAGYGAPPPPYPQQQQQGYSSNYNNPAPPPQLPPGSGSGSGPVPPNLQNLITNLEPNHLQNLLSSMSTPQSANIYAGGPPPPPQGMHSQPGSALMGYFQPPQQMPGGGAPPPPPHGGTGLASAPNGQVMQDILARLGTGQR